MKFFIADDTDGDLGFDMYLRLEPNDDGEMALIAYPTRYCEYTEKNELLVFRADGLHLKDGIDIHGWPIDKNGYIKIVRDK